MRTSIEFGTSQGNVLSIAKNLNAKFIVAFNDHYAGNSKGMYWDVEDFASSKAFNWNENLYDRGITSLFVTDEDIPAIIERRETAIRVIRRIEYNTQCEIKEMDNRPMIDGRWGKTNPKRIEAERVIASIKAMIKEIKDRNEKSIDEMRRILEETKGVSSTMWRVRF